MRTALALFGLVLTSLVAAVPVASATTEPPSTTEEEVPPTPEAAVPTTDSTEAPTTTEAPTSTEPPTTAETPVVTTAPPTTTSTTAARSQVTPAAAAEPTASFTSECVGDNWVVTSTGEQALRVAGFPTPGIVLFPAGDSEIIPVGVNEIFLVGDFNQQVGAPTRPPGCGPLVTTTTQPDQRPTITSSWTPRCATSTQPAGAVGHFANVSDLPMYVTVRLFDLDTGDTELVIDGQLISARQARDFFVPVHTATGWTRFAFWDENGDGIHQDFTEQSDDGLMRDRIPWPTGCATVPSAVRSLTVTAGRGSVALRWVAPVSTGGAAITDYVLQRSPNGTTGWLTINDGVRTATTHTVTGLTNGTRYYFRVLAKNSVGNGAASNVVNQVPRTVPSAPRTLTAVPTNLSGQIRLSWLLPASNGGAVVTDYVLQRSPNGTAGWVTINDGVRTTTSYTVAGLANGTRYYFRVLAKNAAGNSVTSNTASAVPRTKPSAPRTLTAAPTSLSGQVRLSWLLPASNGGSAITDYYIQRSLNATSGWVTINDGVRTTTTYTVTGLTGGTRYFFRVLARNAAGIGAASNIVNTVPRR